MKTAIAEGLSAKDNHEVKLNGTMKLEYADANTHSILENLHVKTRDLTSDINTYHESMDSDRSLMQWLLLQIDSNKSAGVNKPTVSQKRILSKESLSNQFLGQLLQNIDDKVVKGKMERQDLWNNSPRLERTKKVDEHHFPRLARSHERLNDIKPLVNGRGVPKGSIEWISCLLDDMEEKTVHMRNQNEQIVTELRKINAIIESLRESSDDQNEEWHLYTNDYNEPKRGIVKLKENASLGTMTACSSLYDSPIHLTNPDSDGSTNFPMWRSHESSNVRCQSEMPTNGSNEFPGIPPPSNGRLNVSPSPRTFSKDGRISEIKNDAYLYTKWEQTSSRTRTQSRTSTHRYKERSMDPLDSPGQKNKESKSMWFARALSQISLAEPILRFKKEKSSTQASYNDLPIGSQTTLNSQAQSPKGFASAVFRTFRRKASSPAPNPMLISSPISIHRISEPRCMSLGHLRGKSNLQAIKRDAPSEDPFRIFGDSPIEISHENNSPNAAFEFAREERSLPHPQEKLPIHRRSPIRKEIPPNSPLYFNGYTLTKPPLKQY
ncbi:unnamed protein product [Dicrocoelium dendriticum]|nr:unnamed protein product [Dicrocoelium dendriticum]